MLNIKPVISAIIKWPRGLDYPPLIYPAGNSAEMDAKILALLEKHLGRRNDD